jgi:hypothetical protein
MNMRTSEIAHDDWYDWTRSTYRIRVRVGKQNYLWGSATVKDITFSGPLILHIRNDTFGDVITFGTQKAAGTQVTLGTLQPGECVSIPIDKICGVFATCASESMVNCHITK